MISCMYVRQSQCEYDQLSSFSWWSWLALEFVYSEGDLRSVCLTLSSWHMSWTSGKNLFSRRLEDVLRCMAFLGHLTPIGALPNGAHEYSWLTYFFLFPIFMCMQMFANVCVRVAVVLGHGPAARYKQSGLRLQQPEVSPTPVTAFRRHCNHFWRKRAANHVESQRTIFPANVRDIW